MMQGTGILQILQKLASFTIHTMSVELYSTARQSVQSTVHSRRRSGDRAAF